MKLGRLLLLALLTAIPTEAVAQVSLAITTEVDSAELPDLAVVISVTNRGKESAHQLHPTAQVGATKVALPVLQELKPNETHRFNGSLRSEAVKPGSYPMFVTVGYADINGYNFSATAAVSYTAREPSSSDIFGILTATPVGDAGELQLKLKNNSGQSQSLTLTPFLPIELTPLGLPATLTMAPGAEQELSGRIRNFSALVGSRYPAFVTAEYETADRHFTSIVTTMVDVVPRRSRFSGYRNWLIGAGVLLFLAALRQMRRSRKPRSS